MSAELIQDELNKTLKALRYRTFRNAVKSNEGIDTRSYNALCMAGILKGDQLKPVTGGILKAIRNTNKHQHDYLPGPYVFWKNNGNLDVIEVRTFLFAPNKKARKAVLVYHKELPSDGVISVLGAGTRKVLADQKDSLLSDDQHVWRKSAQVIYDTLVRDYLLNLAGVRQCIARQFDDGINDLMHSLLRPDISVVNSIVMQFPDASGQRGQIEKYISNVVKRSISLQQALNEWYEVLGHLPLERSLSISSVVREWSQIKKVPPNLWEELLEWAKEINSPLADYHLCTLFIENARNVPLDLRQMLWQKCANVIAAGANEEDHDETVIKRWKIRCVLAKHYCQHLECLMPARTGDALAAVAWWMAERMACLWEGSDDLLSRFMRQTVVGVERDTRLLRQLMHPHAEPSLLRYSTLYHESVWAVSLLAALHTAIPSIEPDAMNEQNVSAIKRGINHYLVHAYPHVRKDDGDRFYAFDESILSTAETWHDHIAENDEKRVLGAMLRFIDERNEEGFQDRLLDLLADENEQLDQISALHMLRSLAYCNCVDTEELWKKLSDDPDWREKVLAGIANEFIEILVDALIEIGLRSEDKWSYYLPHFLALSCDKHIEDEGRRNILFLSTLWASLCTDTVSAIERLLHGKNRHVYVDNVKQCREILEHMSTYATPWINRRIGATLAIMHVS